MKHPLLVVAVPLVAGILFVLPTRDETPLERLSHCALIEECEVVFQGERHLAFMFNDLRTEDECDIVVLFGVAPRFSGDVVVSFSAVAFIENGEWFLWDYVTQTSSRLAEDDTMRSPNGPDAGPRTALKARVPT